MAVQFNTSGKRYRKSKVRDTILSILDYKEELLSVPEIQKELGVHGLFPNKSTVYREIETLLRERVIREVDLLGGKKYYELYKAGDEFHAVIVCPGTKKVSKIDLSHCIPEIERSLSDLSGYDIIDRNLVFFGMSKKG
jgi:Fe2+ or Zn2+ uptake regulation protein